MFPIPPKKSPVKRLLRSGGSTTSEDEGVQGTKSPKKSPLKHSLRSADKITPIEEGTNPLNSPKKSPVKRLLRSADNTTSEDEGIPGSKSIKKSPVKHSLTSKDKTTSVAEGTETDSEEEQQFANTFIDESAKVKVNSIRKVNHGQCQAATVSIRKSSASSSTPRHSTASPGNSGSIKQKSIGRLSSITPAAMDVIEEGTSSQAVSDGLLVKGSAKPTTPLRKPTRTRRSLQLTLGDVSENSNEESNSETARANTNNNTGMDVYNVESESDWSPVGMGNRSKKMMDHIKANSTPSSSKKPKRRLSLANAEDSQTPAKRMATRLRVDHLHEQELSIDVKLGATSPERQSRRESLSRVSYNSKMFKWGSLSLNFQVSKSLAATTPRRSKSVFCYVL
jgi:hypothetical protein